MKIQLKNKLASRPTHDFTEVCKKHKSSFSCCLRKSFFSSQHIIGDTEVSMLSMHRLLHYFIPLCPFPPPHPHFHPLPHSNVNSKSLHLYVLLKDYILHMCSYLLYFKWYCIDLNHCLPFVLKLSRC